MLAVAVTLSVGLLPAPRARRSAVPAQRARSAFASAQIETAPTWTPAVSLLEEWTREYYVSARDSRVRDGKSMDEFLDDYDWFADDYVLTGPDVGPLCKRDYVATQRGFTLNFGAAAPDLDYLLEGIQQNCRSRPSATDHHHLALRIAGFHLDPQNPCRVWFTLRYMGTHTGSTSLGKLNLPPTNNEIVGGPELQSIWWTQEKQIKWETVGYSGCRFTGTNQGFGGLAGCGLPGHSCTHRPLTSVAHVHQAAPSSRRASSHL